MAAKKKNPLLVRWSTPFEVPPFSEIQPEHFAPAFAEAMAGHLAEIDKIAGNPAKPTFKNTIAALEGSGQLLERIGRVFGNLCGAHTSDALQKVELEMAPKLAEHQNAIISNAALFARIDGLFKTRDRLRATAEERRLIERKHLELVRAGAALNPAEKARMGEIRQRLAELTTRFGQNVLADEKAFTLPLPEERDRAGLPGFLIAAAAETARERGAAASHVITLSRSLIEPFLTFSSRRDLREQAFRAWQQRGEQKGATDNRSLIGEILGLRREQARLLGYDTYADYKLDDTMAHTPAAARDMLEHVWTAGVGAAGRERKRLEAMARSEGANIHLEPWDWRYYAEKVRKADYDLSEADTKPYLQLERVIEAGFHVAQRLFGLRFAERHDVPVYHPDVRAWEVTGRDGQPIGLFLGDYFARPSKHSGAWMSEYRGQQRLKGDIRPIIVNVMGFARGEKGKPTLLSFDDARTLFHELGHALHGLLSDVTFPSLAGTSVAHDFVELPSQLYEHWLLTDEVLKRFAVHHETGKPMPDALIRKLKAARTYNMGFHTVEYVASALVDMDSHSIAGSQAPDAMAIEAATLARIGMPHEIIMRHRSPHFQHVYSGDGYSAGYYSYMWSEMLDADAYAAFEETGDPFDAKVAAKLLEHIYSAGNRQDPEQAYLAFRGRMPTIDGIIRQRGLQAAR